MQSEERSDIVMVLGHAVQISQRPCRTVRMTRTLPWTWNSPLEYMFLTRCGWNTWGGAPCQNMPVTKRTTSSQSRGYVTKTFCSCSAWVVCYVHKEHNQYNWMLLELHYICCRSTNFTFCSILLHIKYHKFILRIRLKQSCYSSNTDYT